MAKGEKVAATNADAKKQTFNKARDRIFEPLGEE
jgi:hypothetical protein